MPQLTLPLTGDGPLVEVGFAASTARIDILKLTGEPYPKPVWVTGLIDTGAGISSVGGDGIKTLGLGPIGKIDVYSAVYGGQIRQCNLYDICLAFAPQALDPEVFQHPQEFGLHGDGHLADLVEE